MSTPSDPVGCPRIDVVGMGPAGAELMTVEARRLIDDAPSAILRTRRHPAADAFPGMPSFDRHYESAASFDDVYRAIVADLLAEARRSGSVVYVVPGSPLVAERTVTLLGAAPAVVAGEVGLSVHPALSFLDLAFARLGVDPVAAGVRLVDGESFATGAAGERGPLLVAQCWSPGVLSGIKLSAEVPAGTSVTVLHHLGLPDERVWDVGWDDLDRSFEPDHLTSLWIPSLAAPVAGELARLDELMHALRQRCPWDREQTHGSLARHLMEESYEVLEAIDALAAVDERLGDGEAAAEVGPEVEERAVADLEEELGDLLFQVYFHAALAAEAGRFTLADVARGVHDKLVSRHPHLFGDVDATTPGQVALNWEALKKAEKGRSSITEGIPAALPALALAAKLQRKGLAVGMALPGAREEAAALATGAESMAISLDGVGGLDGGAEEIGDLLFSLVNLARTLDVDPESALRARAAAFRASVEALG
ncbi:MAG: MazG nucleotide pyrophosphohydrolase domain-containing protein [Acidimicrobiales bacterium]